MIKPDRIQHQEAYFKRVIESLQSDAMTETAMRKETVMSICRAGLVLCEMAIDQKVGLERCREIEELARAAANPKPGPDKRYQRTDYEADRAARCLHCHNPNLKPRVVLTSDGTVRSLYLYCENCGMSWFTADGSTMGQGL